MDSEKSKLLAELENAARAQLDARAQARAGSLRFARTVEALARAGVPYTAMARRVARVRDEPATPQARQRIAAALRQLARRVTRRHAELPSPSGPTRPAGSTIDGEPHKEAPMGRLVKRTVTEEYLEDSDQAQDLDSEEHDLEDEEESDEDSEEEEEESTVEVSRPKRTRR